MGIGIFEFFRPRRQRERLLREFLDVSNRMDFARFGDFLSEDFVFSDSGGRSLEGRDAYIAEEKAFRESAGNPPVVIDSLDHWRGEILLRGHFDTQIEDIAGENLWRIAFRGRKIISAEITRSNPGTSLPAFARRTA